ncbi:hypothetical protein N7E81_08230 [Reichenbachiella carrageenanivorans]|uniref:Uncharacterized protein n=1 Tax=Reichenbachiella carrageenanivorans TaxID=2979869 RepID=A0ABY6D4L8_9BACT|nr:hypothetical protein [Reichenbachiella carrageenanivorans]UXX81086.1 hypothetical protein N7E81_08230 [Reichenbachiella carrageenanivorans]
MSADETGQLQLVELRNTQGQTEQYYLDVESVICADQICKVVPVRLYWDLLGRYQHYELRHGVVLEKSEGQPFDQEDYDLLQTILKNPNSSFAEMTYEDITRTNVHGEVDGYSGATSFILGNHESVIGATWTCFTLWHWVYGEVVEVIREISGENSTVLALQTYIESEDDAFCTFALEEINRKPYNSAEIQKTVLAHASSFNEKQFFLALKYFNQWPDEVYFSSVLALLDKTSPSHSVLLLNEIVNTRRVIATDFYDSFSRYLSSEMSYQEVDLVIQMLEKHPTNSLQIHQQLFNLLTDDILTSRSVYWYLSGLSLTKPQELQLEIYYKKHQQNL